MSIRDQFEDWKYLVSRDNQTSRMFYLLVTVVMIVIFIACIFAFIAAILGKVSGLTQIVSFAALPIAIVATIILVNVLSR